MSIRDDLLKKHGMPNRAGREEQQKDANPGNVRKSLLEKYSVENNAKRQQAVSSWVSKYNAAIQNPNGLDVGKIDELIRQYDGIKDYASAYGLTGAPQFGRQLQELRKTAQRQKQRKLETDILHPERRVQQDKAGDGKSAALPSLSVAEQVANDHIKQIQTETTWQQKYGGKSYGQIKETLAGMEAGEEKTWLENFAPSVMRPEDYDSEITQLENEIYNLQKFYLDRYDNAIKNLGGHSQLTEMIIAEINEKYGSRTELAEYIDRLKEKKWNYENNRKYNFLSENEDFAEQSKVTATEGSANFFDVAAQNSRFHYDMVNGLLANNITADAVESENHFGAGALGAVYGNYAYMTKDEKAIYNYVYNTQGSDAAEDYLEYLKITLDGRSKQYTQQEWKELATALPVESSIASVPLTLWGGVGYLDALGQKVVKDIRENATGEYAGPINYNRAAMMPSVASSTIRGTVSHDLAQKYGTIEFDEEDHPILSKLLNGKSWGDVYQLGMSMVDSTAVALMSPVIGSAGTLLLSGSAATQTMLNAVENGATDEQALTMGALSGAFEYLFEKYELESLLKNGSENVVRAFIAQSLSEGFGEGATTVANTVADTIIMADKSEVNRLAAEYMKADPKLTEAEARKKAWMDIAIQTGWDVVGGMASGGIMGGGYSAINWGTNKLQQLAQEKVNAEQDALQKLADKMHGVEKQHISMEEFANSESPVWRNVDYSDDATKISIMQDAHNAMVADGSVVKVTNETAESVDQAYPDLRDMKKKERTPILKAAMTKLKSDLRQFLNGFKNQTFEFEVNGKVLDATLYNTGINEVLEKVTKEKANMLYSTGDIFRNARYLYSTQDYAGDPNVYRWNYFYTPVQIGEEIVGVRIAVRDMVKGTDGATPESQIYNWGIKKDASLDGGSHDPKAASSDVSSDASTNSISQTVPGVNGENSSSEGQVVRNSDGATVQIADVESAGGGKITVKLTDGSIANISELSFPNVGEQELWRVLAEYSEDAEHARQLLKEYRAGELGAFEYAKGVEEGFIYGKLNIGAEEMSRRGSYVNLLNPMQKNMAYKYGQYAGEKQAKQRNTEASERNAKRERKGGVYYGYEGQTLDKSKLNRAQRVGVAFAERLARRKGITTYFYRSYVNEQGERVYKDREGNIVPANENGWYDPSDGSIHIDLNCGDMGSTVLFTIAHELTHFIQDWSADKYRTLCKILTEGYLEMGQSVDELVRNKQEEYRKRKIELSYEEAFDEVIANSMESVLSDGRVMDLLDDVETKDMNLADRIRTFLEETAELIRDTIQAYRDVKPESPEGRIVQRMQGIHDQLQEVFAAGLHEGGENYRQGGKENTTPEGGVRYSITEPFVDANGTHFNSAVLLDTAFFDGINPRNWGGKLRDFVKMRAATDPFILPVADENGNIQQLQFANPKDRVTKNGQSDHKVLDKLSSSSDNISKLAVIHIDEIVEVSDADVPYHTTDNNHQWLDRNGWLHRTANVINTKNGNIYNLKFDIAKTNDGRHILYATNGKIKRVGNVQVNSLIIRGSGQNSNSGDNVTQSDSNVKRLDFQYQYAVQNGDMNTAQKMVDEAASRAGYTIKAFHGTTNQEEHSVWNAERREWDTTYTPITVFKRQYDEQAGHFFSADKDNAGGYGSYLYSVYLMMKNPLVIECNGQAYNSITFDGKEMDTYEWADYARKRRYDGVIFKNVRDGVDYGDLSEPTTDYVVFDSNRIKSADPVTYDNNGRAIPLSARFSPVKRDIRYSARYQKNALAQEQIKRENAAMGEDVAGLNELVAAMKRQGKDGSLETGMLDAAASVLMQKAGAKGKKTELMKLLDQFYHFIGSGQEMTWDSIRKAAQPAVNWLMDHVVRGKQISQYAKDVLHELRTSRIYLDETQKAEAAYQFGSFGAFRQMLMGSVTIANEGSISLDSRWHELSQLYPDVFREDVSATDMPGELADIINRMRNTDTSELEFEYNREMMEQELLYRIYGSYWNASTLYIVAGQHEAQIRQLKGKHNKRMNEVYQRHRDMEERQKQTYRQRQEAARHHYEEQYQKREAEFRESRRKAVERHDLAQVRQQIKKDVAHLDSLLNKGTKNKNVKLGLQEFVGAALRTAKGVFLNDYNEYDMIRNGLQNTLLPEEQAAFDRCRELLKELDKLRDAQCAQPGADNFHDKWDPEAALRREDREEALKRELSQNMRILRDGNVFQRERAGTDQATAEELLNELLSAYKALENSELEHIRGVYNEALYKQIEKVKNFLSGKAIKDMTSVELKELQKMYRMVSHTVSHANELFGKRWTENVRERGEKAIRQLRTAVSKDMPEFLEKVASFGWSILSIDTAMEIIGSDVLLEHVQELYDAENTYQRDLEHARQFAEEQAKKYGRKNWKLDKQVPFAGTTITLGQAMSLYAYSRRKQGQGHLEGDGFTHSKNVRIKKSLSGKMPVQLGYIKNATRNYKVTREMYTELEKLLTSEQREYVKEMQEYLSKVMGAKGNEVSEQLHGIPLFEETIYFPLKTAKEFSDTALGATTGERKMKNTGFTEVVKKGADNAIVLDDFERVWSEHVNQMSNYHAYVLAMENFNRVYNYRHAVEQEVRDAAGEVYKTELVDTNESVKLDIENRVGSAANAYIVKYMQNLNGGARSDATEALANGMLGNFRKTRVLGSGSVIVQQPSAFLRAMAKLDVQDLAGWKQWREKYPKPPEGLKNEMYRYCPVAGIKKMGGFDPSVGRTARQYLFGEYHDGENAMQKATGWINEKLGKLPEAMDEVTWTYIWYCTKQQIRRTKTDLRVGSKEFCEEAAKLFSQIVRETQVYDSVTVKPLIMQSKNTYLKTLTSFMNEPLKGLNQIIRAWARAMHGKIKKRQALRETAAVYAADLAAGALSAFFYAFRDDDDDETYWEKYLSAVTGKAWESLIPLYKLPYIKDVLSLFEGYSSNRSDIALIGELKTGLETIFKESKATTPEEAEKEVWAKLEKGYGYLMNFAGIPGSNLIREIRGIYYTARKTWEKSWVDNTAAGARYALIEGLPLSTEVSKQKQLENAVAEDDMEHLQRVLGTWDNQDTALSNLQTAIKEVWSAGKITDDRAMEYLQELAGHDAEEAQEYITKWEFKKAHPENEMTDAKIIQYADVAEPAGISLEIYTKYVERTKDLTSDEDEGGQSKQEKVWGVIHSLPISRKQKDALHYASGYKESSLNEAPWN